LSKKTNRRNFLKYAGGAVAAAAIAAAGYGAYMYTKPSEGPTPSPTTPAKNVVKIGTTKPLTGPEAVLGRNEWEGTQLWLDMIKEQGGIRGGDGNTYDVELFFYDDECKPDNVARLFEKLITDDKVDYLLGPIYGPLGMASVPVVMRYGILEFYGTSSYDPAIWEPEYGDYISHTITNGPAYLHGMIDMVLDYIVPEIDPDANSFAIIHGDDIFRYVCGTGAYEYAKDRGCNIVHYEQYSTEMASIDLSPVLTKVKAAKPKILMMGAAYPDAVLSVKQMVDLDIPISLMFPGTGAVTAEWYDAVKPYGDGICTTTQWEPGVIWPVDYGPSHDEYVSRYTAKYGKEPEYCSAIGFTQALALQHAMENCQEPLNADAMREYIHSTGNEFNSFYGNYKVDEHGVQVGHEMVLMQWQDGRKMCVWPNKVANSEVIYPMTPWKERA
jgi:branched-chain amino acid transport system substrate-binding protein